MQVYGQVGGIAYAVPTRIISAREARAMLKKRKVPEYAVTATRMGEDHFVLCDKLDEAISAQSVLMADGWVAVINPPPPVLKNGKSSAQRNKGKRNVNNIVASKSVDAAGRERGMCSPNAESLEFVNSGFFPQRPAPTHNVATQACGKCNLLPCDCDEDN